MVVVGVAETDAFELEATTVEAAAGTGTGMSPRVEGGCKCSTGSNAAGFIKGKGEAFECAKSGARDDERVNEEEDEDEEEEEEEEEELAAVEAEEEEGKYAAVAEGAPEEDDDDDAVNGLPSSMAALNDGGSAAVVDGATGANMGMEVTAFWISSMVE